MSERVSGRSLTNRKYTSLTLEQHLPGGHPLTSALEQLPARQSAAIAGYGHTPAASDDPRDLRDLWYA